MIIIEDGQLPKVDCISINIKELIDGKVGDLKDIIDARFRAIEDKIKFQGDSTQQALSKAFESAQLAITKVELNTNSRFENTNEWRASMKDRESLYATRTDLKVVDDRLSAIENRNMGILVAVIIALLVALLAAYRTLSGL